MTSARTTYKRTASEKAFKSSELMGAARDGKYLNLQRTSRPRGVSPSISKKRQQTITQMHPFYSLFHPEADQEDLCYEEDIKDTRDIPPRDSKRRKVVADEMSGPSISPQSPKTMALEVAPLSKRRIRFEKAPAQKDRLEAYEDLQALRTRLPPPKTPTSKRRMEIPSSQSPADTPLSSSSRKTTHHVSRSPLKEKSMNIGAVQIFSPSKSRQLAVLKEVADSLENEEAIDGIPHEVNNNPEKIRKTAEEIYEELLAQPMMNANSPAEAVYETPHMDSAGKIHKMDYQHYLRSNDTGHVHVKNEILDSDLEESEDLKIRHETYTDKSRCTTNPNIETRTAISDFDTISSSIPEENIPPTIHTFSKPMKDPRPSIDVPSSQPAPTSSPPKTTQDLASAQLHGELSLYTQAHGNQALINESQYENEWTSYPGSQATASMPPQSSSPLQPLSSAPQHLNPPEPESSQPTVPAMPKKGLSFPAKAAITTATITSTIKPIASSVTRPIPPSQATTISTSQPSPTQPSHSKQQEQQQQTSSQLPRPSTSSFSSPPPASFPSKLPPPPALSSSPLLSMKGTSSQPKGAYKWDGRILTDSQLLPASVMESNFDPDLGGGEGEAGWVYEESEGGEREGGGDEEEEEEEEEEGEEGEERRWRDEELEVEEETEEEEEDDDDDGEL